MTTMRRQTAALAFSAAAIPPSDTAHDGLGSTTATVSRVSKDVGKT